MALASVPLATARFLLNDVAGTLWTDAVLLPYLQEAQRELAQKLVLVGVPVVHKVTAVLSVPANTTDLTTVASYPTDLVEPIWLKERQVGQTNQDFIDMTETDFLPNLNPSTQLIWWSWQGEKILLLGATVATEVQLRYDKSLASIASASDPIGFIYGENYLGHRTAALAASGTGNETGYNDWNSEALVKLDSVIRMNVKQLQNLPARRRAYHRGKGRSRAIRDF